MINRKKAQDILDRTQKTIFLAFLTLYTIYLYIGACGIAEGAILNIQTSGKFSVAHLGPFDSIELERTMLKGESIEST